MEFLLNICVGDNMKKGLLSIDWTNVAANTSDEISYFLFLEGKSIEAISLIRNIDKETVQNQIINGKIKYRLLTKSNTPQELLATFSTAGKDDKIQLLKSITEENKIEFVNYIRNEYFKLSFKEREIAIWILGELREKSCIDILTRASVNKSVNLRRIAISALGKLEDRSVESVLLRALEDENPQVLQYSIKALQKIKSDKAIKPIEKIKSTTDKEYLRRAADDFLNSLKGSIFEEDK